MKLRAITALLLTCTAFAEPRPKIGIALGGGGARGCAHIGVLRTLEEMRIPIDLIAGTSMGAVVGGLYASGMTLDEIEQVIETTDWNDALSDRTRYKDLSYRRKEDEIRYLTGIEAGLRDRRLMLPGGFRSGQKLRFLLQSYTLPASAVDDFSKLPIAFRAVATDLETGEAVVLGRGDLAHAIRASMAIPGYFSPVETDGKLLIDGGVANNVPVDVVREMGADIVIAVDVGSPLLQRGQLGSYVAITGQVLTFITRRNTDEQLANADVVLRPPVSQFATLGFAQAPQIIALGATHTNERAASLAHVRLPEAEYERHVALRPQRGSASRTVQSVRVEGSARVDGRVIRRQMATGAGQQIDGEGLRRDVTRIYGLDDFKDVTFSLRDDTLTFNLTDKPWGPTYVRFGIFVHDDLEGESRASALVNITRTRLNRRGGEWRNDFRIGNGLGVESELYQPLDFRDRLFVAPSVRYRRGMFPLFEDERRIALIDYDLAELGADLGLQFRDWGSLRAGVYRSHFSAALHAGETDIPDDVDLGGYRGSLHIVRTDSPTIPHEGGVVLVKYIDSRASHGGEDTYRKVSANAYGVVTRRHQTFLLGGEGGSSLGSHIPRYDEFSLGGLLSFGAFSEGQLHGQRYAVLRVGTYRRIRTLPLAVGGGVYAGGFAEIGNAWLEDESSTIDDVHSSLTLLLAADTIIGPVFLGYARADTSDTRFYLTIGKTF